MGATYTRQSTYADGDTITAAHTNDEFDQLLAAFQASSGHTHDGTANEGGPITKLLGNTLTFGAGTAGTDITITYDGETNDGVMKWMEDEDYFEFSDDILIASTEKLQFRDTAIYINSSADGQLDLVADTEIQIAATTVDINGNVDISGTLTIGSAGISEAELEILDGATVTTDELNIIDGDTSASSVTVADADRVVLNDGGTMKQVAVTDLSAYFDDEITAMPNLVTTAATTVGALNSGSITSGFGNIDNGASNITSGGLLKLDVDADADDLTGDSATGRLTIGAGEDLNLYHGGTNSYIVNDTGNLIIDTAGDIVLDADGANVTIKDGGTSILDIANNSTDVEFTVSTADKNFLIKGTDGSSAITALDIDMALAGKATFNGDVVVGGDLTVTGDDITMGTNTAGNLLVADGTNFNSVAVGDLSAITTIADDDVFLAVDTSGGGLKKVARSVAVAGITSDLVDDTSPQLGANLDTNSHNILIDDAHFIGDENGNEQIIFQTTSSAVNQFDITNAATGNAPELSSTGGDTNIDLKITPKGSGKVIIDGISHPNSDGSNGQFLKTNGSGVLSFATVSTQAFASGTKMLFQQTSAPTNWTKVTSGVDDRALRVVTGTVGTGGSVAMSSALGTPAISLGDISGNPGTNQTVGAGNLSVSMSGNISNTTISTSTMPAHTHGITIIAPSNTVAQGISGVGINTEQIQQNVPTASTGGGGSHNHGHNLSGSMSGNPSISGNVTAGNLAVGSSTATINVQYTDVIIATRD